MSCPASCTTSQIIEPNNDLIVDVGGANSDVQESGFVVLSAGQTYAAVPFLVPKLSNNYNFEYLYIEAPGLLHPGAITIVVTAQLIGGFAVVFAGAPIEDSSYILHWRVVVQTTIQVPLVDAPEDLYLQMPRANIMPVTFVNQRSGNGYGFTELRVENINDPPDIQAVINVQVVGKTTSGFVLAVNPTPPSNFYFLRVRTP